MEVKLKGRWFAPTDLQKIDSARHISGKLFRPGVHTLPDEMKNFLPDDAEILGKKPKKPTAKDAASAALADFDDDRSAMANLDAVLERTK